MTRALHFGGHTRLLAAGLTTLAGIAATSNASAQGLISTQGVIVATDGDPVPNASGTPIPGFSFGPTAALTNSPVLDENGKVLFLARFADAGGSLSTFNDRAFFYGSSRADLKLVVQGGDQAPGLPAGILLRTTSGSSTSLGSSPRISPDGRMWWGSTVSDGGATVTTANDSAIFGGLFGAQTVYVRKGDVAPGTGGATYSQAFNAPSQSTTGINRNGSVHFQATLVTGSGMPLVTTTFGMNNSTGIWAGQPGALELVARKSDPVSGLPGAVALDTSVALNNIMQMNNAGQLLYDIVLSQTQGTPAATASNDHAYMVFTPGMGSQLLVREGDIVPGTFDPGTMTNATFSALGNSWSAGIGANSWTRNGETLFSTDLIGGDVVTNVNNRALFKGGVGTLAMIARRGQPAPGTDGLYSAWNVNGLLLNSSGQICIEGFVEGGTTTSANDTCIWAGSPGSLAIVLREGDSIPGTGGSIAGSLSGAIAHFNDQGQVLMAVTLVGGSTPGSSLIAWDAVHGLMPIVLPGDMIEISAGVFLPVANFGVVQNNNYDGAALCFGHDGTIAVRVGLTGGTNAEMIVRLPSLTTGTPFCFGDGTGTACPCGNSGATGNGCANSIVAAGARITGTGASSIAADTLVLAGTGMPDSSVLYFQGTVQLSGGLGTPFGDGLRCAGGSVVRLDTKMNVGGASQYPDVGDQSVSVRGVVIAPGTYTYQVWYRNAAAFCTASTFNLSNGLEVTWTN